jgi:hypothetical protein
VPRTRVDEAAVITGSTIDGFGTTMSYFRAHKHTNTDNVLPGDGHKLDIQKHTYSSSPGFSADFGNNRMALNYCPTYFQNFRTPAHEAAWTGRPTDAMLATKLLAMTNPSRPVVDLPVFFGELGDLPNLVQKMGKGLLRKIAKGNIRYQFGIRPLVNDLTSMLNFADHTAKRFKELQTLQERGLSRTRVLWHNTAQGSSRITTNSSPTWLFIRHQRTSVTEQITRGHVKWFPASGNFPKSSDELLALARRAVLGLTVDGATAWELIPFSWLADYFSNIGTSLMAKRNMVNASHTTPLLMDSTRTNSLFVPVSGTHGAVPSVSDVLETKNRRTVAASLSAHLPVLSAQQLSILGSLVILRSGRYT